MSHPEIKTNETLQTYHDRCAVYHTETAASLRSDGNYRDAGTHRDLAAVHKNAVRFLRSLDSDNASRRGINADERADTAITR